MSSKEEMKNKCSWMTHILCALKLPSNWLLIFLGYQVWSLLGMRYSSNQNFDMTVVPQYYILLISAISILTGLINSKKLLILTSVGAITVVVSLLTIVISKVGVYWFGYPIGYYVVCPISVFLFLWQIKQIIYFSYCGYKEGGTSLCLNKEDN